MKMLEALRDGSPGIRIVLPPRLTVIRNDDRVVELSDEASGVRWWLLAFPGLHLDLGDPGQPEFAVAARWYARTMFDAEFHANVNDTTQRPRTADPHWTPMVDFEHLSVDDTAALRTVHRMAYRRGTEINMAHLLVPLEHGLFEARVCAIDVETGFREAALIAALFPTQPDIAARPPKQAAYDDPSRDATFASHSLSRVRASIRWLVAEAGVQVLAPAPRRVHGVVELPALGCAFVPPPRFVREPEWDEPHLAAFHRVSFCATDGVETLQISRVEQLARVARHELRSRIERFTRESHEANKVRDLVITTEETAVDGRSHVMVTVEGRGHNGALRNSCVWFVDDQREAWFIGIMASAAVPAAVHIAELEVAARSWRRMATAATARP